MGARRRTWLTGGILLLAVVFLRVLHVQGGPMLPGWVEDAALVAALLVFAIGLGAAGSVTARRPLGTGALVLLAAWQLLHPLVGSALAPIALDADIRFLAVLGTAEQALLLAIAVIAVVQIGRLGVVPAPWCWAPSWALAAHAVPQIITAVAMTAGLRDQTTLIAVTGLAGTLSLAGQMLLGVLAIVLALRPGRPSSVSVYPPSR